MARKRTERQRAALLADAERVIRTRHAEFDFGLGDVADELGCSTRQLQRVFCEVGGTEFRRALLAVRMERARRLLSRRSGGWSVKKVAQAVGYREASGLRQAFNRYYDKNPSAFQPDTITADYDRAWREAESGRV